MRRKSSGRVRLVGIAIAGAALALAILIPGSAFASIIPGDGDNLASRSGGVALERNCNNPLSLGSQAQCSFNVAAPSGKQDTDVSARAENKFEPYQRVAQGQLAIQAGAAVVANDSEVEDVGGNAPLILKSGETDVHGPKIELDLSGLTQRADASAAGIIAQRATTGKANTTTWGNTTATGGDADAVQVPVSVIAAVGFQRADRLSLDAQGGDQEGNRAGDSGDIEDIGGGGGNGGHNFAAALVGGGGDATGGAGGAATITSTTPATGSNTATSTTPPSPSNLTQSNSVNATSTDSATVTGGSGAGGAGGQATQTQTAARGGDETLGAITTGRGGDANSGPAGNGGNATLTQTQSQLTGTPSSSASGSANGGDAHAAAAGHTVVGGVSGDAYNEASIHGGTATNGVSVNATQTGDVAGRSGDVVNNGGSPSAPATVTINQGSQATNTQTQTPSQAANNTATDTQTASTGTQTVTPNNTVSSGQQTASGQNNKSIEVEKSSHRPNNNSGVPH